MIVDPISVIIGALTAGALAGAQDVASSSIKDSYDRLKSLVRNRFGGRAAAEVALDEHEQDPESWEPALRSELLRAGLDADHQVVEHARALLGMISPNSSVGGDTFNVDNRGSRGQQFGRGNTQYN